ncbi:P-loop containing nucleoside triphosphate hydrolases superfamily protein [Raphanus sativus]|nr:P-loop containing nucleoside triphosphate hydrolases superfamily protein [Raphanus sativus]
MELKWWVVKQLTWSNHHAEATADVSHELQSGQPRSSLWVCGNTEAVKLMNEWLCQWRERGFRQAKTFCSSDAEQSQDSDYSCSESDSDSENTGAEDRLRNVLLIVGPVGLFMHVLKSKDLKILESNASECRSGTVVKQKFGEALESNSLSRYFLAEDRGLVCAIQEIAKKAKGPVILTANDKNHGLPENLKRIDICFSLPSTEELFSHLSFAEDVKVNPDSLEQLTITSGGDIRKAIMQLQFWVQSKSQRVRKAKNTSDPDRFDHEAGHVLLPKIITQDFLLNYHNYGGGALKNTIAAKKAAMLRQNTCFEDYDELDDFLSVPSGLTDTSYQPLSLSRPNRRRKANVVMSSDSEDEPLSDIQVSVSRHETSKVSCINGMPQSVDVSCVPESSYVPETLMDGEAELSPRAVSCGHFDGGVEASMSEDDEQNSPSTEIHIDSSQSFNSLMNTCEIIAQSFDGTMMEDCFKDYVESSQKMQQATTTDECSRIDFGMTIKAAQKTKLDTSRDTVQESWRKLCTRHADLKPYLDSEPVEAPQLLDITHQITNLISEADLTHSRCMNFVAMEPMMNTSEILIRLS